MSFFKSGDYSMYDTYTCIQLSMSSMYDTYIHSTQQEYIRSTQQGVPWREIRRSPWWPRSSMLGRSLPCRLTTGDAQGSPTGSCLCPALGSSPFHFMHDFFTDVSCCFIKITDLISNVFLEIIRKFSNPRFHFKYLYALGSL